MPQPQDFPPMELVEVENKPGARIASIRELTPIFRRQPDGVWALCFRIECEQSPAIEWHSAGFATCKASDQEVVIDALREATAAANRRFITHLEGSNSEAISDVVAVELIKEESAGSGQTFELPTAPPNRIY